MSAIKSGYGSPSSINSTIGYKTLDRGGETQRVQQQPLFVSNGKKSRIVARTVKFLQSRQWVTWWQHPVGRGMRETKSQRVGGGLVEKLTDETP